MVHTADASPHATHDLRGSSGRAASRTLNFLRHFGEMVLAMIVGMVVAVPILYVIFSTFSAGAQPTSSGDAVSRYPVLVTLVVAGAMLVPMIAWMRYRGHAWRLTAEMGVAMLLPIVPIFALMFVGTIRGAAACGLYCLTMVPAMLVAMLARFDAYASHAGHVGRRFGANA